MNCDNLLNKKKMQFELQSWPDPELPCFFSDCHAVYGPLAPNIHENLEILYFPEGEGYVLYDGAHLPVRAGDIMIVNSYSAHQVIATNGLFLSFIIVDREFCRNNSIDPNRIRFQRIISDSEVRARFQEVIEAYRTPGDFQKAAIKGAIFELLLFLCFHYCEAIVDEERKIDSAVEYVRRAIGYVKANFNRKVTVDEIAASVGVSRYHFQREFKRITGYAPKTFLNMVRCERARNLLESGKYSIKEISFRCGFSSSEQFSRVFRQHTGLLPSQIRGGKDDKD